MHANFGSNGPQGVTRELAFHAPLSAHISTPESFRHALCERFHIRECHIEVRNALAQLHDLAASPLSACLRSITLSDWSVVHSGILLWIQTTVNDGGEPVLLANHLLCIKSQPPDDPPCRRGRCSCEVEPAGACTS